MPYRYPPMNVGDVVEAQGVVVLWDCSLSFPNSQPFEGGSHFLVLGKNGRNLRLMRDGKTWVGDRIDFKRAEEKKKSSV